MAEYEHVVRPFAPVYDEHSKVLILGKSSFGEITGAGILLRTSAEPLFGK